MVLFDAKVHNLQMREQAFGFLPYFWLQIRGNIKLMFSKNLKYFSVGTLLTLIGLLYLTEPCHTHPAENIAAPQVNINYGNLSDDVVFPAAFRTAEYLPMLKGMRVAVTGNQTSTLGSVHLVDTLISSGVQVVKIFCPEHGFRGEAEAGKTISDGIDTKSGLPVISLYGKHKKPSDGDLKGVDMMVFDIQDVGARFYTYISTLHYIMEACAEAGIPVLVLDRPNPNGHFTDGPVLDPAFRSFVGMHPVALVHGMTMAEYARMINGEGWLEGAIRCDLRWVSMDHYTHQSLYHLPVNPSPNLQDMDAIYLYPSICLLEGTTASVGRGTDYPFRLIGHPGIKTGDTMFVPRVIPGKSDAPKWLGEPCFGWKLYGQRPDGSSLFDSLDLTWLIRMYREIGGGEKFFASSFDLLAGTDQLRKQILAETPEYEIRKSWQPGLLKFRKIREKYLIYP
jgi:uncharacterized protein YbbC (DUF1343 family)